MSILVMLAVVAWFWFDVRRELRARFSRLDGDIQALRERIATLENNAGTPAERAMHAPPRVVEPTQTTQKPVVPQAAVYAKVAPQSASVNMADDAAESLETRIGAHWLLYVGVVAIVVGVAYFVKLAFDSEWITEFARVLIGGVAGGSLVFAGVRFARAGYPLYGQMITGGGIAILYVSIYAAFNFYELIPRSVAFALMALVTAAAAWLADSQRSQGLALMAVGGGFATPFLLASGRDAQIALFTYEAILVAGTMYLARHRDWPALNLVSYAGTVLTFAGWAIQFYTFEKFLVTEIILTIFCGMFLFILRENRRARGVFAPLVQVVLWTAPVLYYLASIAVLYEHSIPMLVYLILLSVAGAIIARQIDSSLVRLIV
ncbi:MAG TPA: DUF2339 domain-containing protein, partial [Vicinamibacterales bacterium]